MGTFLPIFISVLRHVIKNDVPTYLSYNINFNKVGIAPALPKICPRFIKDLSSRIQVGNPVVKFLTRVAPFFLFLQ